MKLIRIFILYFTIISVHAQGQINIDSLTRELKKFSQVKTTPDWFDGYIIKYLDKDGLLIYEISYNFKNKITGNFGELAISYHKYDKKRRCIESQYYDKNGKLCFTDWPPIIKVEYDNRGNKIKIEYFGENKKLISGSECKYNDSGKVIEERYYEKKGEYSNITRHEYTNEGKAKWTKYFNEKEELQTDNKGIAIYYALYESPDENRIVEERFFDKNLKLVSLSFINYNESDEVMVYNETGEVKLHDETVQDESGPINDKQKAITYSIKRYKYFRNETIIEYFDLNDKKVGED